MPLLPILLLGNATAYSSSPGCSIHPEQDVEYPSSDDPKTNIKKFKVIAKTLPVPFVLYADFDAFPVTAKENIESASNTKVRQLHKPSGFACLRVSQVQEFNGEIFAYSGEDSMTVFEHIRDQDHHVRSILSDVKLMKTLTAEQQLQRSAATTCEICHCQLTKKNRKTKDQVFQYNIKTRQKRSFRDNDDLDTADSAMTEESYIIPSSFTI